MEKLPGDYIAGFVDGEGCFALTFRRDVRHERGKRTGIKPVYFYWKAQFVIVLRNDDRQLLERIREALNCGSITITQNSARYQVTNLDDLKYKIVPFFEKHQLYGKKMNDFYLWHRAVDILHKYKIKRGYVNSKRGIGFYSIRWDKKDLQTLKQIHQKMLIYKSHKARRKKWVDKIESIGRG